MFVIFTRARHQSFCAFDAYHLFGRSGNGQCEIPQTTKPIDDSLVCFRLEEAQSPRDQDTIDVRIDLREIGRLEGHVHAKIRQVIREFDAAFVHELDGVRAFNLQPPLHIMQGSKCTQAFFIGSA